MGVAQAGNSLLDYSDIVIRTLARLRREAAPASLAAARVRISRVEADTLAP